MSSEKSNQSTFLHSMSRGFSGRFVNTEQDFYNWQRRYWPDCADAPAEFNDRCVHMPGTFSHVVAGLISISLYLYMFLKFYSNFLYTF